MNDWKRRLRLALRWFVAVPLTSVASWLVYVLLNRSGVAYAVAYLGKSPHIRGGIGQILTFNLSFVCFMLLAISIAILHVGRAGIAWGPWRWLIVTPPGCLLLWSLLMHFLGDGYRNPNWAALYLACSAVGLAVPNLAAAWVLARANSRSSQGTD